MKTVILALLLFGLPTLGRAGTLNETDYPVQYAVAVTMKVGGGIIGNFCTMSLRNPETPNIIFTVQKHGYGSCHVWDSGTIFHGRRKKNEIELLVRDDKGKLKVEDWRIAATMDIATTRTPLAP